MGLPCGKCNAEGKDLYIPNSSRLDAMYGYMCEDCLRKPVAPIGASKGLRLATTKGSKKAAVKLPEFAVKDPVPGAVPGIKLTEDMLRPRP